MEDCLFCKIVTGEIPSHKIYEDENVFVFLDIGPVSKGHTLIIPRVHATDLNAGSVESAEQLMRAVHYLAPKIMKAVGASGYNLGINHGADAGQLVFHTHLHLMPRYAGELRTFTKSHPAPEELAAIAEQIRKEI